jgi:hypothetical protein
MVYGQCTSYAMVSMSHHYVIMPLCHNAIMSSWCTAIALGAPWCLCHTIMSAAIACNHRQYYDYSPLVMHAISATCGEAPSASCTATACLWGSHGSAASHWRQSRTVLEVLCKVLLPFMWCMCGSHCSCGFCGGVVVMWCVMWW